MVCIIYASGHCSVCIDQDPDIPAWCMAGLDVPGGDADAQPKGSGRVGLRQDMTNEPRDASRQCVICQEEKRAEWRALPCAHVFHDKCVKDWLEQNPSCPVCRMTFPTLQAGPTGVGPARGSAQAWLGSTAVTTSDGTLSAMHQVLFPDSFAWLPDRRRRNCPRRWHADEQEGADWMGWEGSLSS